MPTYINTKLDRVVRVYDNHPEYAPGFYFLDEADQLDGIYATELCAAIARDKYFDSLNKKKGKLSLAALQAAAHRAADRVQWIINDSAELGVLVDGVAYFLYKGSSLIYVEALHDDGKQMRYRPVGKREFGECCHPVAMVKMTAQQYLAVPGFTAEGWEDLPAFTDQPQDYSTMGAGAGVSPQQCEAMRERVEEPGVQDFNKSHMINQICELKAELAAARAEADAFRKECDSVRQEATEKHNAMMAVRADADVMAALLEEVRNSHLPADGDNRRWNNIEQDLKDRIDAILTTRLETPGKTLSDARADAAAQAAEFRRVNAALIEEQKAYAKLEEQLKLLRKAKDENDERFMRERDEARDAAVELREKLSDMIIFKGQALACSPAVKDAYASVIQETERRCRLIFEKHEQRLREELAEERNHREKSDSIAREAAKQRDQAIKRAEDAERFDAARGVELAVARADAQRLREELETAQCHKSAAVSALSIVQNELEACYKAVGWTPGKDQCLSEYLKAWVKQSHADEEIAQLREKVKGLESGIEMRDRLLAAGAKTRDALEAEMRELRSRRPVQE